MAMAELEEAFSKLKLTEMRTALRAEYESEDDKKDIARLTKAACTARFKQLLEDAAHAVKWRPAAPQYVTMDALATMHKNLLREMQKMIAVTTEKTATEKKVAIDMTEDNKVSKEQTTIAARKKKMLELMNEKTEGKETNDFAKMLQVLLHEDKGMDAFDASLGTTGLPGTSMVVPRKVGLGGENEDRKDKIKRALAGLTVIYDDDNDAAKDKFIVDAVKKTATQKTKAFADLPAFFRITKKALYDLRGEEKTYKIMSNYFTTLTGFIIHFGLKAMNDYHKGFSQEVHEGTAAYCTPVHAALYSDMTRKWRRKAHTSNDNSTPGGAGRGRFGGRGGDRGGGGFRGARVCHYCKRPGHTEAVCWQKQDRERPARDKDKKHA